MSKKIITGVIIGTAVIASLFLIGVFKNPQPESNTNNLSTKAGMSTNKADEVEVFLFHPTQRCITCITIGKLAGETVSEYFQPELKNGKIEFREINIDLPENRTLAQKFQASGSSLFINAISGGQDNINEDINVWRLTQDEVQFKSYLKNKLDNLLEK